MGQNKVVVIGGGHNGLVCAAYLAKAGLSVTVLEKKAVVGGCVVTEEVSPGWKINTYAFEHYAIQNTPIISDLSLQKFGLNYYAVDPAVFCPFPDGRYMLLYRNLSKTLKHIETLSKEDARSYEKFRAKWGRVGVAIGMGSLKGPASFEELLVNSGLYGSRAEVAEIIQESTLSAANILSENFETDYVPALIAFLGPAAVGQSPASPNTGWLCAWHIGAERLARPWGGSGELTRSLAASARANGARILESERVLKIVTSNGRATGVRTSSGKQIDADIVVSNADPKQTLLKLVHSDKSLSTGDYSLIESIKVTPGFAFKADYLLSGLPDYICKPLNGKHGPAESHTAATFIAPSVKSLSDAYSEFMSGRNPTVPGLMVALHSTFDRSLVPDGKQGLVLETRFTPYKLYGLSWSDSDIQAETRRLLSLYSGYCPGVEDLVEQSVAKSPQDMESDILLPQGNLVHADMSPDQIFDRRPIESLLDGYEVSFIRCLFLCGAGTFPGGGISGVPGRNAAMQIIDKLKNDDMP